MLGVYRIMDRYLNTLRLGKHTWKVFLGVSPCDGESHGDRIIYYTEIYECACIVRVQP